MRRWGGLFFLILFVANGLIAQTAAAQDGIPDNCEYTNGAYYQAGVIARFEVQNNRLALVNWNTGEFVQVVEPAHGEGVVLGWSPDCRYLAAALRTGNRYETVVYDVVSNRRVGSVPDAQGQPHVVTWGFADYLMVETRNGAILWNVPANTQQVITTSFDPYTARNFSRIRWDAENLHVIVNFAVGGRTVFDVQTGQEVTVEPAAEVTGGGRVLTDVPIGGANYPCVNGFTWGYRNWFSSGGAQPARIAPTYEPTTGIIALYLFDQGQEYESIQVVEDNMQASWVQFRGWSKNCRYFAASMGIEGRDASDTVVWDVLANRRVGVFPDAHDVVHPITWGTNSLVIETRDGTYLWTLTNDRRTLIQPFVTPIFVRGREGIQSFHTIRFSDDGSTLYGVKVDAPDTVSVFDGLSGALRGEFRLEGATRPVEFVGSADGNSVAVYQSGTMRLGVLNLGTGSIVTLDTSGRQVYDQQVAISTDGRYVALTRNPVGIYDTQVGGAAMNVVDLSGHPYITLKFIDGTRLAQVSPDYPLFELNVAQGSLRANNQPGQTAAALPGENGYGTQGTACEQNSLPFYNAASREFALADFETDTVIRVIASDLNTIDGFAISPGCRYIVTYIAATNTESLPYDSGSLDDASYDQFSRKLTIWDMGSGMPIANFDDPYGYSIATQVSWSPDGNWAMLRTGQGRFIWDGSSNSSVEFDASSYVMYSQEFGHDTYWDFSRGQVLLNTNSGVVAIDLQTGEQRAWFTCRTLSQTSCNFYFGTRFSVTDNQTLFVANLYGRLAAYDLDTFESHQFHIGSVRLRLFDRVAISPDGRYLVMTRTKIRVWQEASEPSNDWGHPVFEFDGPVANVMSIRFVDNVTVETVSDDGVQRWNVETGALVG